MPATYHMVFVNAILSATLLAGTLFYRFVYPKKKVNLFVLLILVSVLGVYNTFRIGDYESGDFNLHLYRSISFFKNLSEGVFLPSWGGDLNNTFGYPVFAFNYVLHYYIISFLYLVGFGWINSVKIFYFLSFIFSGIFMYIFAKKEFKNKLAAFTAAIFYLYFPYHLSDVNLRSTAGEVLGFVFLPLFLYFLRRLIEKPSFNMILWVGLLFGGFYLAHSPTATFSFILFIPYIFITVLNLKKPLLKTALVTASAIVIGLLLSSYNWLTHFVLAYAIQETDIYGKLIYVSIPQLLYSTWRYGFLLQGPKGELSFIIGYTQLLLVLIVVVLLVLKKFAKTNLRLIYFWLIGFLFFVFLITPYSKFLWTLFPQLSVAQFSFRLLIQVGICVSMLAGYLAGHLKKKEWLIFILCIVTVAYTMLNWGTRRVIPEITDSTLISQLPSATNGYEGLAGTAPRWANLRQPWQKNLPVNHLEILKGEGLVKDIERKNQEHTYIVNAETNLILKENTSYFPGWTIQVDQKPVSINYQSKKYPDIMLFSVSKGLHFVKVNYEDIPIIAFFKKVSLTLFFLIVIYFIFYFFKKTYE